MKKIIFLIICVLFIDCTKHQTSSSEFNDSDTICCDSPSDILDLQPYDNISNKDIQKVKNNITTFMSNYTHLTVEILPNKKLSNKFIYKPRNRYWAVPILKYEQLNSSNMGNDYAIIGITDKDISTSIHGEYNYGIMGLSFVNSKVGIVSTYRVSNQNLWKIVLHEFLHTRGLKHCYNKYCIMCEGGKNISIRKTLCKYHNEQLHNKYN